jgi:hypothetical protein
MIVARDNVAWSRLRACRRRLARQIAGAMLAGSMACLLAACGGTGTGATTGTGVTSPPLDVGAVTPPPTAAPPAGAPTGEPTKALTDPPARCLLTNLKVAARQGDAGSGHRSMVLVFTNAGATACRLYGYPGVAALDSHDTQTAQASRTTHGYLGGLAAGLAPANVDLAAGDSASAMVEASAFNADGSACAAYAGLFVTPPNETHSTKLAWGNDGCSALQIHPVVPGLTGRSV